MNFQQQFQQHLLQAHGLHFSDLRARATELGGEVSLQNNGLFVSRPGYSEAIKIKMPRNPEDWINIAENLLHPETAYLRSFPFWDVACAISILWDKTDTLPEPNPATDPWLDELLKGKA